VDRVPTDVVCYWNDVDSFKIKELSKRYTNVIRDVQCCIWVRTAGGERIYSLSLGMQTDAEISVFAIVHV